MPSGLECLPFKHEYLSSNIWYQYEKPGIDVFVLPTNNGDRQILRGVWQASLAKLRNTVSREKDSEENNRGRY